MRGLLYKEWCLSKKTIFMYVALAFIFALLGVLVALSMVCGNLQSMPQKDPESARLIILTFYYVPLLIMTMSVECCLQSIYSDYTSGWMMYGYTLPVSNKKAISARYIVFLILYVLGLLAGFLNAFVVGEISGYKLTGNDVKNLILLWMVMGTIDLVLIPLALKLKKASTITSMVTAVGVVLYVGAAVFVLNLEKTYGEDAMQFIFDRIGEFRDKYMLFSPIYMVIVILISFIISVKIYQRREL